MQENKGKMERKKGKERKESGRALGSTIVPWQGGADATLSHSVSSETCQNLSGCGLRCVAQGVKLLKQLSVACDASVTSVTACVRTVTRYKQNA